MLALGEFSTLDNFTQDQGYDTILAIVVFIVATLFTQVTMLNMLIAIMGDSFAFAMEHRTMFATRERLLFLQTQVPILKSTDNKDNDKIFMYVIRPSAMEETESDVWEGTVKSIV